MKHRIPQLLQLLIVASFGAICSASPPEVEDIDLHPLSSGTYSVTGKLSQSVEAEFLLDTGASMVMISKRLFKKISQHQQPISSGKVAATMATGKTNVIPTYTISNFVLENGCNLGPVEVAIVNGATRNLIGLNALSKLGRITIDTQENKLLVSNCDRVLPHSEKVAAN